MKPIKVVINFARSISLALIISILFNSCAIHNKFPFICFRSGCVKVAFGIYKIKAWKKNRQGKANMRRNRANSKASLKNKNKSKIVDNNYDPNDTLGYNKREAAMCNELKLVFFKRTLQNKETTDTLIIGFKAPDNELNELDRVQLDGYLYKKGTKDLIKIKLCDCAKKIKRDEFSNARYLQNTNKASVYLKGKGIQKKRIELE